ncbi:MAG: hypothetical protein J3K34DRAFT_271778 [Monoraphidium minutum]|nr:MAG: hypothetical protein J3K34DRAFT_271778 [Monoraphidium minutum]
MRRRAPSSPLPAHNTRRCRCSLCRFCAPRSPPSRFPSPLNATRSTRQHPCLSLRPLFACRSALPAPPPAPCPANKRAAGPRVVPPRSRTLRRPPGARRSPRPPLSVLTSWPACCTPAPAHGRSPRRIPAPAWRLSLPPHPLCPPRLAQRQRSGAPSCTPPPGCTVLPLGPSTPPCTAPFHPPPRHHMARVCILRRSSWSGAPRVSGSPPVSRAPCVSAPRLPCAPPGAPRLDFLPTLALDACLLPPHRAPPAPIRPSPHPHELLHPGDGRWPRTAQQARHCRYDGRPGLSPACALLLDLRRPRRAAHQGHPAPELRGCSCAPALAPDSATVGGRRRPPPPRLVRTPSRSAPRSPRLTALRFDRSTGLGWPTQCSRSRPRTLASASAPAARPPAASIRQLHALGTRFMRQDPRTRTMCVSDRADSRLAASRLDGAKRGASACRRCKHAQPLQTPRCVLIACVRFPVRCAGNKAARCCSLACTHIPQQPVGRVRVTLPRRLPTFHHHGIHGCRRHAMCCWARTRATCTAACHTPQVGVLWSGLAPG